MCDMIFTSHSNGFMIVLVWFGGNGHPIRFTLGMN